jgi:hypothetical protein
MDKNLTKMKKFKKKYKIREFTYPDDIKVDIKLEDGKVNKITYLPEHSPLIFSSESLTSKEVSTTYDGNNFIYQPIPKVGCKTIKTWMLSILKKNIVEEIGEVNFGKMLELQHNSGETNIHDISSQIFGCVKDKDLGNGELNSYARYMKKLDEDNFNFTDTVNNYFKFTFVRNPWHRIASVYFQKFKPIGGIEYANAMQLNDGFLNAFKITDELLEENNLPQRINYGAYFGKDNILSFDGFVDILYQYAKTDYVNFDIHWLPQFMLNDLFVKDFDFIGKLENFESDFNKILETLNVNIKPTYNIGKVSNSIQNSRELYRNNPKLIDKVAEIYKEDIERYDYNFLDLENG